MAEPLGRRPALPPAPLSRPVPVAAPAARGAGTRAMEETPPPGCSKPHLEKLTLGITRILGERGGEPWKETAGWGDEQRRTEGRRSRCVPVGFAAVPSMLRRGQRGAWLGHRSVCRECSGAELGSPEVPAAPYQPSPTPGPRKDGQRCAKERKQAPDSGDVRFPERHSWPVEYPWNAGSRGRGNAARSLPGQQFPRAFGVPHPKWLEGVEAWATEWVFPLPNH